MIELARAEFDTDPQHGPFIRVHVDNTTVAVFLADPTAVVTTPDGQFGIEVNGFYPEFMDQVRAMVNALESTP